MQIVWGAIWLAVQDTYGLGWKLFRWLLGLDLALRYCLLCGSRENSLWLGCCECVVFSSHPCCILLPWKRMFQTDKQSFEHKLQVIWICQHAHIVYYFFQAHNHVCEVYCILVLFNESSTRSRLRVSLSSVTDISSKWTTQSHPLLIHVVYTALCSLLTISTW